MKKNFYFLLFTGMLIAGASAFGQKNVIVVEPDAGLNIGALNDAITAVDPSQLDNTIFELRRDGLYLLNGTISHSGYTLHIRTEAGEGSKAVLQPAVDENGASGRQFQPSGNLTLEEVYLQGRDELGAINTQPIRVNSDGCRIIIDNCVLDYSAQSLVRTSSGHNTVIITNSILRNCLLPDNPSNGRVIDSRGNPNDTLWVSNSTIYNNGATQLRSDGGATQFANFDHNTVFQTSFNHNMALDYIFKANITNNIFYNFLYRGSNKDNDPFFRVDSIFGNAVIEGYDDAGRYFDLSNNNWYVDDTIGYIMDEYGPDTLYTFFDWAPEDTVWYREVLREDWFANPDLLALGIPEAVPDIIRFIENGQVDTAGLFREELTFTNPPPLNLDYWKFYTENGWAITGTDPPNAYADEDPNVLGEVQTGAFDFSYNTDSRSYTAADGGKPLGASKWWPELVSVEDTKLRFSNGVRTYPNPFETQVTFGIEAKGASTMTIKVFDLMGKELYSAYETVNQGNNDITLPLNKISSPGIYLYKIQFVNEDGRSSTSSGKLIKR